MKHIISLLTLLVACGLSSNLFAEGKNNSDIPLNYSYSAASKMILPVNYGAGTCHLITDPLDITIHPPFADTAHYNESITIQVLYNKSGYYTSQLGKNNIIDGRINTQLASPSQNSIRYTDSSKVEELPFMPYIKAFGGKVYSAKSYEIQNFSPVRITQSTLGTAVIFTMTFDLIPSQVGDQAGKKYSDITFTLPSRDILYLQIRYNTTVRGGFADGLSGGYAVRWVREDVNNKRVNYLTLSDNRDWNWTNISDINGIKSDQTYIKVDPSKDYTINRQTLNVTVPYPPQVSLGIYSSVVSRDSKNLSIDDIDAFQDYFRFSKKNILGPGGCTRQGNGDLACDGFIVDVGALQLNNSKFNLPVTGNQQLDRRSTIAALLPSNILRGTLNPSFLPSFSSTSKAWFDSPEYDNYKGSFTLKEIVSKMDYIDDTDNTIIYGRFNLVNTEALDIYVGEPNWSNQTNLSTWRSFGIYGEPMIFRPAKYKDSKGNVNIISPKDLRDACY
ncbi:hypothetical protein D6O16_23790 [Salmonella enterica]|nr:hypothetical protein [Salmonella enterica]ECT6519607.1 hypothetical protein [Salmonella enterica]EDX8941848.1 hypothetical protein [Salmonella enterica subsp. enterica serovar Aba]EIY0670454.1 hypothetical protein [Salmonella enterica]